MFNELRAHAITKSHEAGAERAHVYSILAATVATTTAIARGGDILAILVVQLARCYSSHPGQTGIPRMAPAWIGHFYFAAPAAPAVLGECMFFRI